MRKPDRSSVGRVIAAFLVLTLILPNPALALRTETSKEAGAEEQLQLALAVTPTPSSVPFLAGAEELPVEIRRPLEAALVSLGQKDPLLRQLLEKHLVPAVFHHRSQAEYKKLLSRARELRAQMAGTGNYSRQELQALDKIVKGIGGGGVNAYTLGLLNTTLLLPRGFVFSVRPGILYLGQVEGYELYQRYKSSPPIAVVYTKDKNLLGPTGREQTDPIGLVYIGTGHPVRQMRGDRLEGLAHAVDSRQLNLLLVPAGVNGVIRNVSFRAIATLPAYLRVIPGKDAQLAIETVMEARALLRRMRSRLMYAGDAREIKILLTEHADVLRQVRGIFYENRSSRRWLKVFLRRIGWDRLSGRDLALTWVAARMYAMGERASLEPTAWARLAKRIWEKEFEEAEDPIRIPDRRIYPKTAKETEEQLLRISSKGDSQQKGGVEEAGQLGRPGIPPDHRAVIFGVGNIGRGYLAPMLTAKDDFDVIFADLNRPLIDAVKQHGRYTVTPVGAGDPFEVSNVWAIPANETEKITAQGPRADWIFTAVGANNIVKLAPTLRRYIQSRIDAGRMETLNIVFAENLPVDQPEIEATRQAVLKDADEELAKYVRERVNFIGASGDWGEANGLADLGFREHAQDRVGFVGAVVQITVPKQRSVPKNPLDIHVEGGDYTLIVDAGEMKQTHFIPKGIEPVANIRAYREKKLLIHNLGHAVLAYLSMARGLADSALGMEDPEIARWVRQAMEESAAGLLHRYPAEFSPEKMKAYIEELLGRFANKELGDTVERIGQDPLRKLSPNDRLFGAAAIALAAGRKPEAITLGIAAGIRYARGLNLVEEKIAPALQLARQLGLDLPESDEAFWAAFHSSAAAGAEERQEDAAGSSYGQARQALREEAKKPEVVDAVRKWLSDRGDPPFVESKDVFLYARENKLDADIIFYAIRDQGYESSIEGNRLGWRKQKQAAGAEEPKPPEHPKDFSKEEFPAVSIGGSMPYIVKPGDPIFPTGVTYQTMQNLPLDPSQVHPGTEIKVRKIKTITVPLAALGRFAMGPLTFQILPMGEDQQIRPPDESSGGGVAVAPMAKRYLLQVWLDGKWADLDLVHLEDGVPVRIGREDLPAELDGVTQFDLEGKVGRPVNDKRYREVFERWYMKKAGEPEWRVAVSWTENELDKIAYLPRQALSNSISRGDARVEKRPGWNAINGKFVPAYRQTGHLQIEIMGDEVAFSDLGSTNPTQIEVRREWAQSRGHRYRVHERYASFAGNLWEEAGDSLEESRTNAGTGKPEEDPSVAERAVSELVERLKDQLVVIDRLQDNDEVPLNPQKLARFPFERPFQISIRVDGEKRVTNEFKVEKGQIHVRQPGTESWKPAGTDYRAEEWIEVAGQSHLEIDASRVEEGYHVLYAPITNTVVVLNYSPYQLQISPLTAAGAEEGRFQGLLNQLREAGTARDWNAMEKLAEPVPSAALFAAFTVVSSPGPHEWKGQEREALVRLAWILVKKKNEEAVLITNALLKVFGRGLKENAELPLSLMEGLSRSLPLAQRVTSKGLPEELLKGALADQNFSLFNLGAVGSYMLAVMMEMLDWPSEEPLAQQSLSQFLIDVADNFATAAKKDAPGRELWLAHFWERRTSRSLGENAAGAEEKGEVEILPSVLADRMRLLGARVWDGYTSADDGKMAGDDLLPVLAPKQMTVDFPATVPSVKLPEGLTLWVDSSLATAIPAKEWGVTVRPVDLADTERVLREEIPAGGILLLDQARYTPELHRSMKTLLKELGHQGLWIAAGELQGMDASELAMMLEILKRSGIPLPSAGMERELDGDRHRFLYA